MMSEEKFLHDLPAAPLERIGLDGFWMILRRHLMLIVLLTTLMVTATALILDRLQERFTARATLVLTMSDTRISQTKVQLESFELSRALIETELDVLRSREFAAQVAERLDLFDDPRFMPPPSAMTAEASAQHSEHVIDRMQSAYVVYRSGESLAIDIIATAAAPDLAASIANAVSETYISTTIDRQRDAVESSITLLRERVRALGEDLTNSELEMADFIRENQLDVAQLPERLRSQIHYLNTTLNALGDGADAPALREDLAAVQAELQARTEAELAQMRMERLLELQRSRYQTAITKLNELETQVQFTGQSARQVSKARPPADPSWPNKPVALAISGVAGLFLSIVIALMLDLMNRRLRTEDQTIRLSKLPNMGILPRYTRTLSFRSQPSVVEHLVKNPRSMFAQSLRSATSPWFENDKDEGWIAMVTSGLPDEGKSTVAVALGVSTALDGMKVLILDLDSRRMGAAKLIRESSPPVSLLDVVQDKAAPKPVEVDGAPVHGLDFLAIDPDIDGNLKEQRQVLLQLRNMLRWDYDLVIVDTPPILVIDDTRRFGVLADEIWQVVRWGHTTEEVLEDAVDRLKRDGLPVTGTIINDVDTKRHHKMGYGGYAQYYSHGDAYYE